MGRPSTAQRWNRWQPETPERQPTIADLEASVFSVIYLVSDSGVTATTERVLAFDEAQAREFGTLRMVGRTLAPASNVTVRVEPLTFAGVEFKAAILTFETAEEWQQRQDSYRERQTHG